MNSTNSRKGQTSITHLMNFALPPRPQYQPPPRNTRRYASWGLGSGYHAMDKARYVHANYRFIVAPNRKYYAQAANADVHLDWDSVLQVLVSAQTQSASCPICLSTPVAPRMARCGHIFCLPCLIRYMHSTDDHHAGPEKKPRWKKCPICWDSVYISETRPVRWFRGQEGDLPFEGGDVVLRLVKRDPSSTLALPRDGAEPLGPGEDIPWYHAAEVSDYARIMKGGEDYMAAQYDAEIEDIRQQQVEDELLFGDETTWSRKAISAINDAKLNLQGIGNPPDVARQPVPLTSPEEPVSAQPPPEEPVPTDTSQDAAKSGDSSSSGHIPTSSVPAVSNDVDGITEAMDSTNIGRGRKAKSKQRDSGMGRGHLPSARNKDTSGPHPPDHPYYFYQGLPHFYLSSLDIRILKAAFGDYSLFPATILPRVEHISTGHIVDDELRKRTKYLSHLPQGCEVSFLECDWTDVVAPEVLQRFSSETGRRRKRNREKEHREEKSRVRAEKAEDAERWATIRKEHPGFETRETFFSDRDFQPLVSGADAASMDIGVSASPPQSSSHLGASSSPSTSPPGSRTVWGTAAIAPPSGTPDLHAGAVPHDGWLQGWEDELMAQRESEVIAESAAAASNAAASPAPTGGKKKKKNKITLMSTNIQRGA